MVAFYNIRKIKIKVQLVWFSGIGLYLFFPNTHCALVVALSEKTSIISEWLQEMRLVYQCFPKHLRIRQSATARMKYAKVKEDGKKREASKERSIAGTKEKDMSRRLTIIIKIK